MSDTAEDSKDKGFHIDACGMSCDPCRWTRQFFVIKKRRQSKKITREQRIQHLTKGNTNFASGRHQSPDNVFKPVLICRQEALIYAAQEGLTRITPNMFTHSGTWSTIYVQSGEDTKNWPRITEAPHQCYRARHCSHVLIFLH